MSTLAQPETTAIEIACQRLGINRSTGYAEIQRSGTLAGVPVIRAGKRLLVPTVALDRLLTGTAKEWNGDDDRFHS